MKICVCCYYHYIRNLKNYAKKLNLLDNNNFQNIFKNLLKPPYIIQKNPNYIEETFELYNKNIDENLLDEYKNYFDLNWKPFYENGYLNYSYISKEERCYSYIENYNRGIKLKLSEYLYGRNKCRIAGLYFYFLLLVKKMIIGMKYMIMK